MTVYSTATYQACNSERSNKIIHGMPCKLTDQAHLYDVNKLFANVKYDLELPSTIQVMIQNNLLMDGYDNLPEFEYFTAANNDFILSSELIQPFKVPNEHVYLITAYSFDNEIGKAEIITHEAEYSPSYIYFTSNLHCALSIMAVLLSTGTNTGFLQIEKTTIENAKYQVSKRIEYAELIKPQNSELLLHAGDYWATYQLYTNCGTDNANFDHRNHYRKAQAHQALKDIKEQNWHSNPKTLVVQGCILVGQESQKREYKKALSDMAKPCDLNRYDIPLPDRDRATWVIENYKHSQSIRQMIGSPLHGGHS